MWIFWVATTREGDCEKFGMGEIKGGFEGGVTLQMLIRV